MTNDPKRDIIVPNLEGRTNPPIHISLSVTYWVGVQCRVERYTVHALNLSEDGIFFKLNTPLALGTDVLLQFRLPGVEYEVSVEGQVVWVRNRKEGEKEVSGKGIHFTNIDGETREFLQGYQKGRQLPIEGRICEMDCTSKENL